MLVGHLTCYEFICVNDFTAPFCSGIIECASKQSTHIFSLSEGSSLRYTKIKQNGIPQRWFESSPRYKRNLEQFTMKIHSFSSKMHQVNYKLLYYCRALNGHKNRRWNGVKEICKNNSLVPWKGKRFYLPSLALD